MAGKARIRSKSKARKRVSARQDRPRQELVIITGLSGSGKASALKAFEDLGYYCVDNLPVDLIRRFSETRRPHPFGADSPVRSSLSAERRRLRPIRAIADWVVDTSKFNVHELRAHLTERFQNQSSDKNILVSCVSFGFKHGVPEDADLVFDVRFLPNPHFVPEFRPLTGRHPKVARYIRSFPQTQEFINRISELLVYLLPHYVR